MTKAAQYISIIAGMLLFVFVIAMPPTIISKNRVDSALQFHWSNGPSSLESYVRGLLNGQTLHYMAGRTERAFLEQVGSNFKLTLVYMTVGASIAMTIGILLGIYFSVICAERLKRLLELTSVIPDFVIVLLLQLLVVVIVDATGVSLFQVASVTTDDPAIALPLISAILIPGTYIIRNVTLHMNQTLTEDYISFAKARGMGKRYIIFFHALPNVLPFVKADLHKFLGILFGNLFIFEYLYNLNGVTALVFSNVYAYNGYQYNLVVNGIFTWTIIRRHLFPHLMESFLILFVQEIVLILSLFGQLGIFNIFVGGTVLYPDEFDPIFASRTNEWSGLIGQARSSLYIYRWLLFIPLVTYIAYIIGFHLIGTGLENCSSRSSPSSRISRNTKSRVVRGFF
ncbi:binding-protein-dependent transport system inner membrane component [Paenibacillus taihuensis]|uniref:Binding-protein-dependent transport system inner membrane component n=1 Tax=Paenibacillus taihuensis TaxID=1156355 RepID=A0A3D9SIX3_9BACL|nr:ABC transporter permease subunit [Paenibacillus taihuensis]REE88959.1 binding-protein-dependent transport system inner membrane component [Paenibacillus taihuensis]